MKRVDFFPVLISLLLVLLVTLPYLVAFRSSNADYVFAGAFLNLQDANSYLAKMYQGWSGEWRFRLPFTAEPGQGAYLFLFYITLGHLARIFNLTLLFTYHLTRILGAIFLSLTLWVFYRNIFSDRFTLRAAYLFALFGAGMGWILLLADYRPVDFWVAEAYPFLSDFVNPHFPIGLALMLWLLMPQSAKPFLPQHKVFQFSCAFLLGIINPFGVVIVLVTLFGLLITNLKKHYPRIKNYRDFLSFTPAIQRLFWISSGGLPVLIYSVLVTRLDPLLARWNLQNQTLSPPIWDVMISFSPLLILAIFAAFYSKKNTNDKLLGVWLILAVGLIYLPVDLQRRFMMGLYIPIAGLAASALAGISKKRPRARLYLVGTIIILILPTNIFILLAGFKDVVNYSPRIYLSAEDAKALEWIQISTSPDALILAGPEMGMFIPAFTGRRVIYGHGLETVNADEEYQTVMKYFSGEMSTEQATRFFRESRIDFLYFGPREKEIGLDEQDQGFDLAYQNEKVAIYQVMVNP